MKLALFDFDGTITNVDSMLHFIEFCVGKKKFWLGLCCLSPILILYKLKIIPNDIAKQKFLAHYFKSYSEKELKEKAKNYSLTQIDKIVKANAIEKIKWHQQQGHEVVIVSASMQCWLKPWCDKHDIQLISTRLDFKNGKFIGKFATKNCYGVQKVKRIKEAFNLEDYETIYAYGDSKGDAEMLSIADTSHFKFF